MSLLFVHLIFWLEENCAKVTLKMLEKLISVQFHQPSTSSFFVRKYFAQLFSNDSLALLFFAERLAQKLLVN